jgi:hypothetical protein
MQFGDRWLVKPKCAAPAHPRNLQLRQQANRCLLAASSSLLLAMSPITMGLAQAVFEWKHQSGPGGILTSLCAVDQLGIASPGSDR